MNRELARKHSAGVVLRTDSNINLPRHEVIVRSTRRQALEEVRRMARSGEIGSAYALAETPAGYAVKVVRIRERGHGGFRWALGLALLTSVGLTLLAAWLLVNALLPIFPFVALVAVTWLLLARTHKRASSVTINQSVHFRHRA